MNISGGSTIQPPDQVNNLADVQKTPPTSDKITQAALDAIRDALKSEETSNPIKPQSGATPLAEAQNIRKATDGKINPSFKSELSPQTTSAPMQNVKSLRVVMRDYYQSQKETRQAMTETRTSEIRRLETMTKNAIAMEYQSKRNEILKPIDAQLKKMEAQLKDQKMNVQEVANRLKPIKDHLLNEATPQLENLVDEEIKEYQNLQQQVSHQLGRLSEATVPEIPKYPSTDEGFAQLIRDLIESPKAETVATLVMGRFETRTLAVLDKLKERESTAEGMIKENLGVINQAVKDGQMKYNWSPESIAKKAEAEHGSVKHQAEAASAVTSTPPSAPQVRLPSLVLEAWQSQKGSIDKELTRWQSKPPTKEIAVRVSMLEQQKSYIALQEKHYTALQVSNLSPEQVKAARAQRDRELKQFIHGDSLGKTASLISLAQQVQGPFLTSLKDKIRMTSTIEMAKEILMDEIMLDKKLDRQKAQIMLKIAPKEKNKFETSAKKTDQQIENETRTEVDNFISTLILKP